MNSRADILLHEAKQLTEEERETLIEALQATLPPLDPEWETAWIKECNDRLAAYDSGEMGARDADEVIDELRAALRAR
jgi:hypothetical protein